MNFSQFKQTVVQVWSLNRQNLEKQKLFWPLDESELSGDGTKLNAKIKSECCPIQLVFYLFMF